MLAVAIFRVVLRETNPTNRTEASWKLLEKAAAAGADRCSRGREAAAAAARLRLCRRLSALRHPRGVSIAPPQRGDTTANPCPNPCPNPSRDPCRISSAAIGAGSPRTPRCALLQPRGAQLRPPGSFSPPECLFLARCCPPDRFWKAVCPL